MMTTEQSILSKLAEKRSEGDKRGEIRILRDLGTFYQSEKRWQEAEETCYDIIKACKEMKDLAGKAQSLVWIAKIREMAGDILGAREFGEQAIGVLKDLSLQEWTDAIRQPDSLITLDAYEKSVSPDEALRLHILNARSWVNGLRFRAIFRFYLVGALIGILGGIIIGFYLKSVLLCVIGGAIIGALILGTFRMHRRAS